jgi:hypothetical protein
MRATAGTAVPFRYASINGWYYTSTPATASLPGILLRALEQSRGRVVRVMLNGVLRPSTNPALADRALLGGLAKHWREQLLPRYQRLVAERRGHPPHLHRVGHTQQIVRRVGPYAEDVGALLHRLCADGVTEIENVHWLGTAAGYLT